MTRTGARDCLSDEEIRARMVKAYEGQDFMVLLPRARCPATGASIMDQRMAHCGVVTGRKASRITLYPPSASLNRGTAGPTVNHWSALGLPGRRGAQAKIR